MDMTPNTNSTHTLDTDSQTPPPTQPTNTSNSKSSSFTNGSLKHHHTTTTTTPPPPSTVVSYKECLKNHAASIGRHALDGCGEFMPSSSSNPSDPRSLTCAACGCHRNFHRRDNNTQHHHHPHYSSNPNNFLTFYQSPAVAPPLPHRGFSMSTTSPSSLSPSPISSSPSSPPPISHHFPPSYAPNMLFVLGNACSDDQYQLQQQHQHGSFLTENNVNPSGKKRHRTKFSKEQKEKMHSLCEKLGWRMNKEDEGLVREFCNEVGVPRGVFKVWMHNNKNAFRKRSFRNISE